MIQTAGTPIGEIGVIVLLVVLTLVVALVARQLRFPYTLALVLAGLLLGDRPPLPGAML
jgi:NhaP-type Na+/H+ or K+/H+ antiporter